MQADWFVVFAKTGDPASRLHTNIGAFIVDADSPGVTRPRVDKKMGVKGIDTTEIVFTDVAGRTRAGDRRRFRCWLCSRSTPCDRSSPREASASPKAH
jgi:alkylation response protein AidB-like acyl-CoA dehydrogenase